jgi:hypothetical protein
LLLQCQLQPRPAGCCPTHTVGVLCLARRTSRGVGSTRSAGAGSQARQFKIQDCQGGGPAWVSSPLRHRTSHLNHEMLAAFDTSYSTDIHALCFLPLPLSQPQTGKEDISHISRKIQHSSAPSPAPDHGFLAVTLYSILYFDPRKTRVTCHFFNNPIPNFTVYTSLLSDFRPKTKQRRVA